MASATTERAPWSPILVQGLAACRLACSRFARVLRAPMSAHVHLSLRSSRFDENTTASISKLDSLLLWLAAGMGNCVTSLQLYCKKWDCSSDFDCSGLVRAQAGSETVRGQHENRASAAQRAELLCKACCAATVHLLSRTGVAREP